MLRVAYKRHDRRAHSSSSTLLPSPAPQNVCSAYAPAYTRLPTYVRLRNRAAHAADGRPRRLLGPLTQLVQRTLTVTNPNVQPVAFKVKTTAPKVSIDRILLAQRAALIRTSGLLCSPQLGADRARRVGRGAGCVPTARSRPRGQMYSRGTSVMLQAMKEEPPLAAKCKDKFLIQSTFITPAKETMNLKEIVSTLLSRSMSLG
jgi:hypothetical protein